MADRHTPEPGRAGRRRAHVPSLAGIIAQAAGQALQAVRNLLVGLLPAPDFVVLDVSGPLPERHERVPRLHRWLGRKPVLSLEEVRARLRRVAADPRVDGVVLKVHDLQAGFGALEALRAALEAFRASEKHLAAYLPMADLPAYYVASAAHRLVAPESAELALLGPRAEVPFLRAALDRLGVLPQFHHIAEYKTAANRWLYPEMPAPQREMLTALLTDVFDHIVAAVASSRGLAPERVREAVDEGLLSAEAARSRGLVDLVAFEDDLPRLLGRDGRPARLQPWAQVARRLPVPVRRRDRQGRAIAVVQLVGAIVPGESRELPIPLPLLGRRLAGHETVARAFRAAERMARVAAVVFHVDSPGGSAVASDLIWREVERVNRRKPVVVHMGSVAGSGGYYVSCAARRIVAARTTLTGSIGVVAGKFSVRELAAKAGVRPEVIALGATATMPSATVPYTDREWAALRRWMDEVYARFKARVAAGRRLTPEAVEAVARGRVWTGAQALAHGLVDELGDFEAAVRTARELARIPPEVDVPVVTVHPPRTVGLPVGPEAWGEALAAVGRLLAEPAWLLMPTQGTFRGVDG